MSTLPERVHMVHQARAVAESNYMSPDERIAVIRLSEIYEAYKMDLDPDFQGISPIALAKAAKESPEGEIALGKLIHTINVLLMSGKFGQVDWKLY